MKRHNLKKLILMGVAGAAITSTSFLAADDDSYSQQQKAKKKISSRASNNANRNYTAESNGMQTNPYRSSHPFDNKYSADDDQTGAAKKYPTMDNSNDDLDIYSATGATGATGARGASRWNSNQSHDAYSSPRSNDELADQGFDEDNQKWQNQQYQNQQNQQYQNQQNQQHNRQNRLNMRNNNQQQYSSDMENPSYQYDQQPRQPAGRMMNSQSGMMRPGGHGCASCQHSNR